MSGHSRLSASAASRWIRCPGSIQFVEFLQKEGKIAKEESSAASIKGTACHSVLEYAIKKWKPPTDLKKKKIAELSGVPITYKDLEGIESYYDYIKAWDLQSNDTFAERKYDLSYRYGIDLGGTADVTQCRDRGALHIGDYKNGRLLVEVEDNYQLLIYGLGAYYELEQDYGFNRLTMSIGQPNAFHPDGCIRSETITIKELLKWEKNYLKPAVQKIKHGTTELIPGEKQCQWCPARNVCTENARQSMQLAQLDFAGVAEPRQDLPDPKTLTKQQIIFILDNKSRLINFLGAIEEHAVFLIGNDERLGHYNVTEKLGNRRIKDAKGLREGLRKHRIPLKSIQAPSEPKFLTMSELERFLVKDRGYEKTRAKEIMDNDLTTRTVGKRQLVKSDSQTAERDFKHVTSKPAGKRRRRKPD